MNLNEIASTLDQAVLAVNAIPQLHLNEKISLHEAYQVQELGLKKRMERGEVLTGVKMGFTSEAKRIQMGLDDLIWGGLTDKMELANGGKLDFPSFIHPRVEPEIAFLIGRDINAPIQLEEATKVIDGVAVALEIIDSRYENFKFSLEDVVADNCSSAAYVLGKWNSPTSEIQEDVLELWIDGELVQQGEAKAIMGNPYRSLVDAIRLSLKSGLNLKKGQIVLAGAATPAVYLQAGQTISCKSIALGEVNMLT
ncbi:MAG: fumarylacetoacetate hydrolase family protein [Bacteroidia bacterium]|nr:fumarylacetoacetate hydrolase family protein [Bacteroidia bacterium]